MNRRQFLSATVFGSGAFAVGAGIGRAAASGGGLRALGDAAGIEVSAGVSPGALWANPPVPRDWQLPELDAIMRADLHTVCCGSSFNPGAVMRWQNKPHYPLVLTNGSDEPDLIAAYAKSGGFRVATFAGVWQEEIPDFIANAPNRAAAIAGLRAYLKELTKFKGNTVWHRAVNEWVEFWRGGDPVAHVVTKNRYNQPNAYYTKIGPDYPEVTFQILRELDPKAKLMLNQYGLWEAGRQGQYDKAQLWTLDTIRRFQAKNIKVDILGIESHFVPGHRDQHFEEARFAKFLSAVQALGVDIYLTELDAQDTFLADRDLAVRNQKCADETRRVLDVAFANKAVVGLNFASLTDWQNYFLGAFDKPASTASNAPVRAALYDEHFKKKPMWDAVAAALRARAKLR